MRSSLSVQASSDHIRTCFSSVDLPASGGPITNTRTNTGFSGSSLDASNRAIELRRRLPELLLLLFELLRCNKERALLRRVVAGRADGTVAADGVGDAADSVDAITAAPEADAIEEVVPDVVARRRLDNNGAGIVAGPGFPFNGGVDAVEDIGDGTGR